MKKLIENFMVQLSKLQKSIDVEGVFILGISADRWLHFAIGVFCIILFYTLKRLRFGVYLTVFLVLIKELFDVLMIVYYEPLNRAKGMDSLWDIAVGLAGLCTGLLIVKLHTQCKIKTDKK